MSVVPAAPGTRAVIIGICPDLSDQRPTEADVYYGEYPVIAWRVLEKFAVPVLVRDVPSDDSCFVVQPNGSLLSGHPFDEFLSFESLDEAKAMILARAQRSWDYRRAAR